MRSTLLITDHTMPGMTGLELVQRLREQSFRGNHGALGRRPENRALFEALAVKVMMSKPFDVHQLRAPITRLANGGGCLRAIKFNSVLPRRIAQPAQISA